MVELKATIERWPVNGAFVMARGTKTHVDVVFVEARDGTRVGHGEGTPIYYRGETAEGCVAQIAKLSKDLDRQVLQELLPPGASRNAVDCALWDLDAQRAGVPVWQLAGLKPPRALVTAMTVSLDDPRAMEESSRALAQKTSLLKVKLAGEDDAERIAAVRRGAPDARLILDVNEAWSGRDILAETQALLPFGVELLEQPFTPAEEHLLEGIALPIPVCADESVQDRTDLAGCIGRYQVINIKLDKAGGLTEALALKAEAQAMGLRVMVGCMLATSLGIAPANLVAQGAEWADLDGALLLARDRSEPFVMEGGLLKRPQNPEYLPERF